MIPTVASTSVATLGQPTDQPARHPTVPTTGRLQNRTTRQAANDTNSHPAISATGASAIPPGNHTDVQRTIRTIRCMTNQPATPRQSRATRAPKREIPFHRSRFSFPLPHHLKRNGYANRKRNTLHRLLHPEGRGGQDDPDGAGGQLPALRERAERGGGGLRLSAAQHRRNAQARLENRHGGRTLQGDGLPPTATYRQEGLPGRRGHGGGCRGKGGRTIGEAARHGHRVLRPARHGKQRRRAADAGEHGLHFLAHRGRPGGDGKHTAFRHQAEGHANGHGQDEHQGAVPAVEHGGRAREVGTLRGV